MVELKYILRRLREDSHKSLAEGYFVNQKSLQINVQNLEYYLKWNRRRS